MSELGFEAGDMAAADLIELTLTERGRLTPAIAKMLAIELVAALKVGRGLTITRVNRRRPKAQQATP